MTSRHDVMAEEHLQVLDAVGRYVFSALIHRLLNHWVLIRSQRREGQFQRGIVKLHNTFTPREVNSFAVTVRINSKNPLESTVCSIEENHPSSTNNDSARDRHRWLLNIRNVHRPIEDPSCDRTDVKPVSYRSELPSTIRRKETWDWRFTFSSFHAIHTAIQKG